MVKAERLDSAKNRAVRARSLPLPWEPRQTVLSALVLPRALYGCSVSAVSEESLKKLRCCVVAALWKNKVRRRCPAIILTLLAPGHRLDPQQGLTYLRLKILQRMWQQRPDLHASIRRVWTLRMQGGQRAPGPLGLAFAAARSIGWVPADVGCWTDTSGANLDMRNQIAGLWQHTVREGIRRKIWQAVPTQRRNLQGVEAGIDRSATCKMLSSRTSANSEQRPILRRICADSVWTESLRFRIGRASTPVCPHCHPAPETLQHLWWECSAWGQQRAEHAEALAAFCADGHNWPPCLALCGVLPCGSTAPVAHIQGLQAAVLSARHAATGEGATAPGQPRPSRNRHAGRGRGRGGGCGRRGRAGLG